ncbi:MAG: hypothetical protein QM764_14195 [Chitinophagaceae bacterium]
MNFQSGNLYHIYNQGNNRQTIFVDQKDYILFTGFIRKYLLPYTEIIGWCLMPNHFHFMCYADERSNEIIQQGGNQTDVITNGIRKLLSGYARVFNSRYHRTGSVFRPKTKSKCLTDISIDAQLKNKVTSETYYATCFHYIHQNPLRAGLVNRLEDWEYSSFKDYAGLRNGTLCNKQLAAKFTLYDSMNFITESYKQIPEEILNTLT